MGYCRYHYGCVVWGAIALSGQSSEQSNEGVEIKQNIKGNPEATVTLVEYSDFQCPACAAFQPALDGIMQEYGDSFNLEYKHFPLSTIHPHALSAAIAAEAAGQQGKFFEFHDLLFANQQEWSSVAVPATFYVQYAEQIGLDIDQFKKQQNSSLLRDKVRADFSDGQELGLTGTPTFFLNGQRMQFDTYESFVGQIIYAVDPDSASSTPEAAAANSGVRFGL